MSLLADLERLIRRETPPRVAPRICHDCDRWQAQVTDLNAALAEVRGRYKSLQRDYTKKAMELAELKRKT